MVGDGDEQCSEYMFVLSACILSVLMGSGTLITFIL